MDGWRRTGKPVADRDKSHDNLSDLDNMDRGFCNLEIPLGRYLYPETSANYYGVAGGGVFAGELRNCIIKDCSAKHQNDALIRVSGESVVLMRWPYHLATGSGSIKLKATSLQTTSGFWRVDVYLTPDGD